MLLRLTGSRLFLIYKNMPGLNLQYKSLTQDLDTLRKKIALLKTQKEDLHHDYQKILSKSVHSRQAVNFLEVCFFIKK